MAYFGYRQALVNRSGSNIPVYETLVHSEVHVGGTTAGGTKIGTIYPNEFYTIIPNDSMYITSYKIIFRDPKGNQKFGYIETNPAITFDDYEWAQYQEPYQYYNSDGKTLVSAAKETIDKKSYYIFTVHDSPRIYRDSSGTYKGTIPVGAQLATNSSTTGQTYGGYMVFNKKKISSGSWQDLISGSSYGFVDLGLDVGSFPSNRPIW